MVQLGPLPKRPDWYPDWSGKTVVIVASGYSAPEVPLDLGIGRAKFVAINRSLGLCPWADIWYCCDYQWWDKYYNDPVFHAECGEFRGSIRVCVDYRIRDKPWGVKYLHCDKTGDTLILDSGRVGWGGNSGFNCLNFVAQLEPAKIILVGFDMSKSWGAHWHPPHPQGLSNPTNVNIERWRRVMEAASDTLKKAGLTVINCSPISSLKKYPKMTFEQALDYVPGTPLPEPLPRVAHPRPLLRSPIPEAEKRILDPLEGCRSMLEAGNKKNKDGTYKAYFEALGIEHVSIDLNGNDGALALDLRQPLNLGRRFDFVTNFGTSEHVDDQEPCWRNLIEHTGHIFVSGTPLPGDWSWHGRWYPRPDFYKELATRNGFSVERLLVEGLTPRRIIHARMSRQSEAHFSMPPMSMIYENKRGHKVGKYR